MRYQGMGFQKGDCGISYSSIKASHQGKVTFTVRYLGIDQGMTTTINLLVFIPPSYPQLSANVTYNEGDAMNLACSALGGRPIPNITLLLGEFTICLVKFYMYIKTMKMAKYWSRR